MRSVAFFMRRSGMTALDADGRSLFYDINNSLNIIFGTFLKFGNPFKAAIQAYLVRTDTYALLVLSIQTEHF